MPKKCLVCKAESNRTKNRSFHMFPKNEFLRKKWVDSLMLLKPPNFKTSYICSEHFEKSSFYTPEEYRVRKRLFPDALPVITSINSYDLPTKHIKQESPKIEVNCPEENDVYKDINLELNMLNETDICTDNESLKNPIGDDFDNSNFEVVNEEDLFNDFQNKNILNDYSNDNKRKQSLIDINPKKKIRFVDGCETEYITQKDFVSVDAWNRFLKFVTYKNSQLAAAHDKNARKAKKLKTCLELIADLLKLESNHTIQYLEV